MARRRPHSTTPQLLGLNEVATLLGRSKPTAARYTHRPDFPEPLHLLRGRLWLRTEVETWAKKNLPLKPGAPKKGEK
jgi:predicted DNA-binding transcriptional regulator AlpA